METPTQRDKEQPVSDTNKNNVQATGRRRRHSAIQDVTGSTTSAEVNFINLTSYSYYREGIQLLP